MENDMKPGQPEIPKPIEPLPPKGSIVDIIKSMLQNLLHIILGPVEKVLSPMAKKILAKDSPLNNILKNIPIPSVGREFVKKHRMKILIGVGVLLVLLVANVLLIHPKPKVSLEKVVSDQKGSKEAAISVKGFK
ncbi:MAG: hypothetical protein PHS88_12000, partial [Candidatus Omnitrophica bacterium]|nr:hypothetical protein [Candidatus Omnitrophota bacterium]